LNKLLVFIVLSSIVPLAFGIYQFLFKTNISSNFAGFNRIAGTFMHTNGFAQYLLLILFVLIYIIDTSSLRRPVLVFLYLLLGLVGFELLNTFSRGTWIALFASMSMYYSIKTKFFKKTIIITICIVILYFAQDLIKNRFVEVIEGDRKHTTALESRYATWDKMVEKLWENPLTGNGIGMQHYKFSTMAHNAYLQIAYENGFLVFAIFVFLLMYMILFSIKGLIKTKNIEETIRFKIAASLTLSLIIIGIASNVWSTIAVLLYFLVIIVSFLTVNTNKAIEDTTSLESKDYF
jgi:O-antigen ligase